MSTAYQKRGVWYLSVKDGSGRWVHRRTSAKSKSEAHRLLAELDVKFERQRLGLEMLPTTDGGGTVAELLTWWLDFTADAPSHSRNVSAVKRHLLASELAPVSLAALKPEHVEAFLASKGRKGGEDELGPQSLNHLRGFLVRAFNAARRVGRWAGANPASSVHKRRVPKRPHDYLRPEEVPPVLAMAPPQWRCLLATAIYTGMRKGELLGLRKVDVDLKARLITVGRSHSRDTTKGGHADTLPIAAEAVPWLEAAMKASPSELVFSRADGARHPEGVKLVGILRRAMGRAGIATGWRHVCRRKGCRHVETVPDKGPRRCPEHGMKLWPKPIVRPIRFHDTRHTTGSLLTMAGANPRAVQKLLRHSDSRMTEIYAHLAPEYLRAEVDRLAFGVNPPEVFSPFHPEASEASLESDRPGESVRKSEGVRKRAIEDSNLWPSAPEGAPSGVRVMSPGVVPQRLQRLSRGSQSVACRDLGPDPAVFFPHSTTKLAVVASPPEQLLSVRAVAEALGVSTATVYALVERGELPHVRVSNAIRFTPTDLGAYVRQSRKGD